MSKYKAFVTETSTRLLEIDIDAESYSEVEEIIKNRNWSSTTKESLINDDQKYELVIDKIELLF